MCIVHIAIYLLLRKILPQNLGNVPNLTRFTLKDEGDEKIYGQKGVFLYRIFPTEIVSHTFEKLPSSSGNLKSEHCEVWSNGNETRMVCGQEKVAKFLEPWGCIISV